jgi:hypothetical protein
MVRMLFILGRNDFLQALFNRERCVTFGKASAVGEAEEMSINGNGGFPIGHVQHHVCRFSPDARQ